MRARQQAALHAARDRKFPVAVRLLRKHIQHTLVFPRLGDEVRRAAAHGFDGQIDGAPGGHHNHGHFGLTRVQRVEERQTFRAGRGIAGVIHVDHDHVVIARCGGGQGLFGRKRGLGAVAIAFEEETEGFEDIGLIVHHQNFACNVAHHKEKNTLGKARLSPMTRAQRFS